MNLTQPLHSTSSKDIDAANPVRLPGHIAIIMDGNRRWARQRGKTSIEGHKAGTTALRATMEALKEYGIRYLTIYAFSAENWNRSEEEVSGLMNIFRFLLKRELAELHKNGVCIHVLGDTSRLPSDLQELLSYALKLTSSNTKFHLAIALSYGARQDILNSTKQIAAKVVSGDMTIDDITECTFSNHLSTKGLPSPDLLIRTSGEKRISNFLLWELSYTEFIFMDVLWPDFTKQHLDQALEEYTARERRFGGSSGQ